MAKGNAKRRYFPGMERACPGCGNLIVVTEQMCRRRTYTCRTCKVAKSVDYARRNREKKRSWNNAWHAKNSANRAKATKSYRSRHPDRRVAHQAVQTAVRNGTLIAQPCSVCGAPKAHAHHEDYLKPLDVIWLCHQHHMAEHQMLEARNK